MIPAYIAQGGSWADGLLYLAHHANHKTPLLDAYGQLPLMQPLTLGETGWSAMPPLLMGEYQILANFVQAGGDE